MSQRVGAPRYSAADYYVHRANPHLWEHMQRYSVATVEEGVSRLRYDAGAIWVAGSRASALVLTVTSLRF